MYKKWIHIFLSVWLINSVTYFHGSTYADLFNSASANSLGNEDLKLNSWTDCLIHILADDDGDSPEKAHKIKYQRRYVRNRTLNDKANAAVPNFYVYYHHYQNEVAKKVSNYTIGVALLPAYYNFLFRLSPF